MGEKKGKEPKILRHGKAFHTLVQTAWYDPNDLTFGNEKPVQFEYPPSTNPVRSGRMDVYFAMPDGSACIFEIKATLWEKVKYRRSLLGAHRRQLLKYVDQYLLLHGISVVATMIYPRRPHDDDMRREIEDYMGEWSIQVMWYE